MPNEVWIAIIHLDPEVKGRTIKYRTGAAIFSTEEKAKGFAQKFSEDVQVDIIGPNHLDECLKPLSGKMKT